MTKNQKKCQVEIDLLTKEILAKGPVRRTDLTAMIATATRRQSSTQEQRKIRVFERLQQLEKEGVIERDGRILRLAEEVAA